jgi:hypothetical protein
MASLELTDYTGALNQHSAPHLIANNQSPMMVNVTLDMEGSAGTRPGSEVIKDYGAGEKIRGIGLQRLDSGVERPFVAAGGALYYWDGTDFDSTASGTDHITDAYDVNFVQFNDYLYYISAKDDEYLMKVSDAATPVITEVDSEDDYEGKYLAVTTGNLILAGSHRFPSRVFVSKTGTDQFNFVRGVVSSSSGMVLTISSALFNDSMNGWEIYNITEGQTAYIESVTSTTTATLTGISALTSWTSSDTVIMMADYFDFDGTVTGITSLGEQAPALVFTKSDAYILDPISRYSRKMEGFGCSSHKNISVIQGNAIWANLNGVYRMSSSMSYPQKISLPLENEVTLNKVWNKITLAGMNASASWSDGNKYYLAIGDLSGTVDGVTLNDVVLVYNFNHQGWQIRTYTTNGIGYCFGEFNNGTSRVLLAGSRDRKTLYQFEVPDVYTDDTYEGTATDYEALYRTKHFEYKSFSSEKQILDGYVKGLFNTTNDIKIALSGADTYSAWTTLEATAANFDWGYQRLSPLTPSVCKSFSIEVSGTGKWILYAIGLDIKEKSSSNLKSI